MVRQAMPSAWPSSSRLGFCSTMQVLITCGISDSPSSTSLTRPLRTMFSGLFSSGFQNVVSVIQQASFSTRSLKPKASNISMVRQATPSAWPSSSRLGFCSTMQVLMSANAESCAASVSPAGPQPTIRTSTSGRNRSGHARWQHPLGGIGDIGLARLKTVQVELHGMTPRPGKCRRNSAA